MRAPPNPSRGPGQFGALVNEFAVDIDHVYLRLANGIGRAGDDVTVEDDKVGTLADHDTTLLVCAVRGVRGIDGVEAERFGRRYGLVRLQQGLADEPRTTVRPPTSMNWASAEAAARTAASVPTAANLPTRMRTACAIESWSSTVRTFALRMATSRFCVMCVSIHVRPSQLIARLSAIRFVMKSAIPPEPSREWSPPQLAHELLVVDTADLVQGARCVRIRQLGQRGQQLVVPRRRVSVCCYCAAGCAHRLRGFRAIASRSCVARASVGQLSKRYRAGAPINVSRV